MVTQGKLQAELVWVVDRLLSNLCTAAAVFMTDDLRAACLLAKEKETVRDIAARATAEHFKRLSTGRTDTA